MNNFTSNLHIIYTDESSNFSYPDCNSYSMSSIIAPYNDYVNKIEPNWNKLRKKYNIPDGVCLHFTDIKALLNPKYFNREIKKRNLPIENIFCQNNQLNQTLLNDFYNDVLDFIKNNEFVIVTSNLTVPKSQLFHSYVESNHVNSTWYRLFKKHLDDLAEYALRNKYSFVTKKNGLKATLNFRGKIRYDGDYNLSNKNDIRDAFSHSITTGTSKFNSATIRNCFDELRFINKSEVGFCSNCSSLPNCSNKNFSHAGNEIVDFIAAYAGKYLSREDFIKYFSLAFPSDDANISYQKAITILVNSKILNPIEAISNKIYIP